MAQYIRLDSGPQCTDAKDVAATDLEATDAAVTDIKAAYVEQQMPQLLTSKPLTDVKATDARH